MNFECRGLTLVVFVFLASSLAWSQDSLRIKQFENNVIRMNNMMSESGSSLEHLKVIFRQLKEDSDIDENTFASMMVSASVPKYYADWLRPMLQHYCLKLTAFFYKDQCPGTGV